MLTVLILLAAASMVAVLVLLAVVVVGIRREPGGRLLASHTQGRVRRQVRRLLGVSVVTPGHVADPGHAERDLTDIGVR